MTDESPPLFTPPPTPKRWRILMVDGSMRSIVAPAFRVDAGALVMALPAGSAAAFAPGEWRTIEPEADA